MRWSVADRHCHSKRSFFGRRQQVVVDDDVDVHNPTEVEWAVATRFQADLDLVLVMGAQGSPLDPCLLYTSDAADE